MVDPRNVRLPRIDCTFLDDDVVEVIVAYRYGFDIYTGAAIVDSWDLRVLQMEFTYTPANPIPWALTEDPVSIASEAMVDEDTGQSHPDIVYDQVTGDIYCAWNNNAGFTVEIFYQRLDEGTGLWEPDDDEASTLSEGNLYDDHNGWFVTLDAGNVTSEALELDDDRVLAFTYTAHFGNQQSDWWGFRPMVGWWGIDGVTDDGDHEPQLLVYNPIFGPDPKTGKKPDAGMIKIDIPGDDATEHGAAIAFVQETPNEVGDYEVYGGNSLNATNYTRISIPGGSGIDDATLPSLAIHDDGEFASVTFFRKRFSARRL